MKQIAYGSTSFELKFDTPVDWDIKSLTGVNIQVGKEDATEVLESTAATLYTATTLDGNVEQFSDTIVLDAGATAPNIGDMLTLVGTTAKETVIVKGYNATTKTVTTSAIINNSYDDGDDVYGNKVTYDFDVSDTTTFTAGVRLVVTWTPTGTGTPFVEQYQITKFIADTSDLERDFQYLHPRAYEAFKHPEDRFDKMVELAEERLVFEMRAANMDYHRIIGEPMAKQLLMGKMACIWLLNGDEDLSDEREEVKADYAGLFKTLQSLPIWTDTDQDKKKEDELGEVSSHNHIFQREW